jgi:hypothetical protein
MAPTSSNPANPFFMFAPSSDFTITNCTIVRTCQHLKASTSASRQRPCCGRDRPGFRSAALYQEPSTCR